MAEDSLLLSGPINHATSSKPSSTSQDAPVPPPHRVSPTTGLTTFPTAFEDEPEPGILPTFISKVKNTFAAGNAPPVAASSRVQNKGPSNGRQQPSAAEQAGPSSPPALRKKSSRERTNDGIGSRIRTEAQEIAEAARQAQRQNSNDGINARSRHGSRQSTGQSVPTIRAASSVTSPISPDFDSQDQALSPPLLASGSNSFNSHHDNARLRPPFLHNQFSSSSASIAPSHATGRSGRLQPPGEWRPKGAAAATVTISPITSVTTTVQASGIASPRSDRTGRHVSTGSIAGPSRSHVNFQAMIAQRATSPYHHQPNPKPATGMGHAGVRLRRASIATLPDSPSSISLSAMIAANAEFSSNATHVPGFPLGQDDTRSVQSFGLVKKSNSVSRLIRRMRGEGLSKHYWMADEHCKECYDCKSVFTAWRRKHHCRICGQIFCSRCASNIIGARRFGQEGAVRVCNLCLKIMEEYKDEDEDDRRSINSFSTSFRPASISDRAFLDAAISPDIPYAKSPFAASQLFTSHPNESLTAIDESSVPTDWRETGSRPYTPIDDDYIDSDDESSRPPQTAAPFRRPMYEDGKDDDRATESGNITPVTSGPPSRDDHGAPLERKSSRQRRVEFPRTETISTDGGVEIRVPLSRVDSNNPLIGLRTRLSSRASLGGLNALLDSERGEGLWRARSHSFAQRPQHLSGASLEHFMLMLEQTIDRAKLPHPKEWLNSLSKLLLQVSGNVRPNVRAGDSIDVRAYVKIKKVPGGKISDSEYVDGIVITKNVAHKAMARRLVNPRIMVVTFPLDYHRVENQFMSLDPILAQEKDYLRLLTRRIVDVRPHIVLAERSASRIALEYLLEANIAVARSVKMSAIHQVARCTQADVVGSMDRLALEPRLGRCAEFQIQSFEHDLIPGRRKTLMRFEGCHRDLGCTIILRGGDLATLRKVKIVTDFMGLVAVHLTNEVILYNDEHNALPPHPQLSDEYQQLLDKLEALNAADDSLITPTQDDSRQLEKIEADAQTREIAKSLKPYLTTALSASAAIRFPPPAPLAKMAHLDRILAEMRQARDQEEEAQILQEEKMSSSATQDTPDAAGLTRIVTTIGTATRSIQELGRDPYRVLRKPEEIARASALAQVDHQHKEHIKLWQWYTKRHPAELKAEDFQGILYLESLGCEGSEKPCVEPTLHTINFYQPDDLTVGQYLEALAADAVSRCQNKNCDRLMLFHFRLLVHGDRRLQIAMDQFPCPSPGHEDKIITWSYCRVCANPSPTTILSEETWKFSWGAYLEHCFYPPHGPAGFNCPHDAYRDQIRYFAHRNLAIRIHNEQIDLYEPLRPSITLQTRAETKVVLKNHEYESILSKSTAYFDSVLFRLKNFDCDIVQPEKVSLLRTAVETLLARAVADREELVNLLNRTYKLTPMTDVLSLNAVLRTLQDKVVQWDQDFGDTEKAFMPSEKDLRRMTATHLKRLFASQDGFGSLDRSVAGLTVSEADEKELKPGEDTDAKPEDGPDAEVATQVSSTDEDCQAPPASEGMTTIVQPTPTVGLFDPVADPFSNAVNREYDSDSTIPAMKKDSPVYRRHAEPLESSGMDSDVHGFVSRLPRRTKPTSSVADIVSRFQDKTKAEDDGDEVSKDDLVIHRTFSRRARARRESSDVDAGELVIQSRPRLRRGRTEQSVTRYKDNSRSGAMSDNERGYAANASRIPSSKIRRGPTMGSRSSSRGIMSAPLTPPRSGRSSPAPERLSQASSSRLSADFASGKSRVMGKGKSPRPVDGGLSAPGMLKTATRRSFAAGSSRVTSIARHFDRLSREAEKERQKRLSAVRGKRARPVGVTKAKVQVFNNLREAFKDEFDTDSSEADNEEDDEEADESGDSDGIENGSQSPQRKPSSRRASARRRSSAAKQQEIESLPVAPSTSTDTVWTANSETSDPLAVSASASSASVTGMSVMSDVKSEMSFTDRLQIELPSFETSAPLPSVPVTPQLSTDTADEGKKAMSQISQVSESELSSGGERSSILKTLTGLWAFRAGDYTPLEYPLSAAEHVFADSKVIIRENEPTSIIAFTLSSKTYRDKMRNSVYDRSANRKESFMPEDSAGNRSSTWDIVSMDEAIETEDAPRMEEGTHLKYDFESGASTIFCRIFFAERFAQLRASCEAEESFVESLSRCVQFDASGGKSGSAFLKTKDDRFIAKEISRLEMDALTKFAPAYFEYTKNAINGQRPSALAKVYGFFKIGYRNAITGRQMKMNVLVMENLFYERRFSRIYDLKGSMRNRLIQPTGRINEVLLDENLMEISYKHPLYLREHSKRILKSALFNDTLFLSNLNVMDYSLVVGVDAEKHELVIGIVDYIRTFTWDKKLESWVKDSTFLGGTGKGEPTIVTPKQYKTRFRTAMDRSYFPSVPDRWSKVGIDDNPIDEDAVITAN